MCVCVCVCVCDYLWQTMNNYFIQIYRNLFNIIVKEQYLRNSCVCGFVVKDVPAKRETVFNKFQWKIYIIYTEYI